MTLACEDGNSKLVEVVTVADVDSEKVLTIVWYRFDQDFFYLLYDLKKILW